MIRRTALSLRDAVAFLRLYLVAAALLVLQLLRTAALPPRNVERDKDVTVVLCGAAGSIAGALRALLKQRGVRVVALVPPRASNEANGDIECDLRSRASIRSAASDVLRLLSLRDASKRERDKVVLVHAAGLLGGDSDAIYAVNLLGPALLTEQLGAAAHRVVFFGSAAHAASPTLRAPLLTPPRTHHGAYPESKLLLHALAAQLAARGRHADGVHVLHPGIVHTPLYRAEGGAVGRALRRLLPHVAWTPEHAAARVLHLLDAMALSGGGASREATYWDARTLRASSIRSAHAAQLAHELASQGAFT